MLPGAVNVTDACPLPAVAVPIVGAPGTEPVIAVTVTVTVAVWTRPPLVAVTVTV